MISADLTDGFKNIDKEVPDLKEWAEKMSTWRDIVYNSESAESIDIIYEEVKKIIKSVANRKQQEEFYEEKERINWWKNYYQKQIDDKEWWRKYWAKEHDWQKDNSERDEENKIMTLMKKKSKSILQM